MKTFKEFVFSKDETIDVHEGQNVDVLVIDEKNLVDDELDRPTNFISIEMEKGYKSYVVELDPQEKTCWVRIYGMNWARPTRLQEFKDAENFKPYITVTKNPYDYDSFDYWLKYWTNYSDRIPAKVRNFKPQEEKA